VLLDFKRGDKNPGGAMMMLRDSARESNRKEAKHKEKKSKIYDNKHTRPDHL
jgi:hypothetical protein